MSAAQIKVLAVFAVPRGTMPLRYGSEGKIIRESVLLSRHREKVALTMRHTSSLKLLHKSLSEEKYDIVHISGHATGHGLELEDENGDRALVPQATLASILRSAAPSLRCVVLNECYSVTDELESLGVPFTIVMDLPIDDEGMVEFCHGFYDGIAGGKGIATAYMDGCKNVQRAAPNRSFVSRILTPPTATPKP